MAKMTEDRLFIQQRIADICLLLARSALRQRQRLLSHLLDIAAMEANRSGVVFDVSPTAQLKDRLVGAWAWEVQTDLVFADARVASYFGLDAEDGISGLPIEAWIDAIHIDDRARVKSAVEIAVSTGEVYSQEYRVMTTHGLRWVYARGKCIASNDGKPLRFPGALIDITEEKLSADDPANVNS